MPSLLKINFARPAVRGCLIFWPRAKFSSDVCVSVPAGGSKFPSCEAEEVTTKCSLHNVHTHTPSQPAGLGVERRKYSPL